jgi:hypothetical protein
MDSAFLDLYTIYIVGSIVNSRGGERYVVGSDKLVLDCFFVLKLNSVATVIVKDRE